MILENVHTGKIEEEVDEDSASKLLGKYLKEGNYAQRQNRVVQKKARYFFTENGSKTVVIEELNGKGEPFENPEPKNFEFNEDHEYRKIYGDEALEIEEIKDEETFEELIDY